MQPSKVLRAGGNAGARKRAVVTLEQARRSKYSRQAMSGVDPFKVINWLTQIKLFDRNMNIDTNIDGILKTLHILY